MSFTELISKIVSSTPNKFGEKQVIIRALELKTDDKTTRYADIRTTYLNKDKRIYAKDGVCLNDQEFNNILNNLGNNYPIGFDNGNRKLIYGIESDNRRSIGTLRKDGKRSTIILNMDEIQKILLYKNDILKYLN